MKRLIHAVVVAVLCAPLGASAAEKQYEDFDPSKFSDPTNIDNEWYPMKPGTRFTWEGTSVEFGLEQAHRVVFTVTDLVKEIAGVQTVVCWDQDFVDGELAETEIVFFAQDDDGAIWSLGEYPEEYKDGVFFEAPFWIHGISDANAGILIPGNPKVGMPSFAQGWAPSVGFTDRGEVGKVGVSDTVPFGSYDDVLIIDEWDKTEPDARSHKSYARGVGHIRVASKGRLDQETLVLTKIEQLDANEMEKARKAAIKLEQSARDLAPDEYGLTQPLELASKAKAKPRAPAQPSPVRKVSYIGSPDPAKPGTEEFGLSPRQLVMAIEQAESSIAACMREQGFEYVAVDYRTIRRGMNADKRLPGLTESEFIHKYGYGLSTLYTGAPPQDTNGYSPAKMGLGRKNIEIYRGLSPADRVAYNRALLGEAISQTLSVGLESENFNRTGGCTRQAVEQVFSPEQLKATYVNPKDVIIYRDPRMKAAVREYAKRMRDAGFEYGHPDDVEADILQRLDALTDGRSIRVEALPPDRAAALEKLKDFERRVAVASLALELEFFEPIEERVFTEMFGRKDQTP